MLEELVVTFVVSAIAGLIIWLVKLSKEKRREQADKKTIYDCLYKRTKQYASFTVGTPIDDPRWVSTTEIASYTNLSPDRVRHICSIHEKIRPMMKEDLWPGKSLEEKWAIREFVDLQPKRTLS